MTDPLSILLAQTPGAAPPSPLGALAFLVPLILVMAIFYIWQIAPENRRRRELQRAVGALKPGDKIITSGGIHAVVANVKDKTLLVKIADNVKIEIQRAAVQQVLSRREPEEHGREQPEKPSAPDKA